MRLTNVLCRFAPKLPGGHLWRGKYRLYKIVRPEAQAIKIRQYELEERNMFYLRHPYLTKQESFGHGRDLGHYQRFYKKMRSYKLEWFNRDHITLGDHLGILKVSDKWE